MSRQMKNRWLVVLGAVMIQVCLGAVYIWSLFNQPLIDKYGWDKAGVVLTFSIAIFFMAFSTIFAGKIQDKIGPRWVATAGGIILGLGLILASRANTLMEIYLFYGVIGGIGIGTAYVCPLATCVKWFPDKRGLISGIAVAGFGLGALLFKPIASSLLSAVGVSQTFLYLGIIYLSVVTLGAQLLEVPPAGYCPPGFNPPASEGPQTSIDFTTGQMLSTYQFYLAWLMYLFGCTAGLMVIGLAKDIGTELVKLEALKAANAVVIISLFNATGRILGGTLSDKLGRIPCLLGLYLLAAASMFFMASVNMTYFSFLTACSIIGLCFGGFLGIFPSLIADYYGTANFGINYGIVFMAYGTAAVVGPRIASSIPFTKAFLVAAILCLIAFVMSLLVKRPPAVYPAPAFAKR